MRKFIKLEDKKKRAEIRRVIGVSEVMLSYSLGFKKSSRTAVAIRIMAMENGGTFFEEKKEWDKKMLQ